MSQILAKLVKNSVLCNFLTTSGPFFNLRSSSMAKLKVIKPPNKNLKGAQNFFMSGGNITRKILKNGLNK